jgi:ribosomal protein S18 acetylase RimI-like enzyme
MNLSIKGVGETDLESVLSLMREFAAYEDLSDYCVITVERLRAAILGENGFVEGLIARYDFTPVGYALFYPCFGSFRGERGMYLEDIYVNEQYRRSGAGLMLLKEIARLAASRGFERIDFLVLDWNEPALAFYRKHGAESNDDETHFKFAGDAFRTLAA